MFTQPTTRQRLAGRLALFAALFLVIVGAKFRLIDRYGIDLPYWDQWDAEGDRLIRPYVEGHLTAATFFAPHNEHRPAFTRLLSLGLFELDDQQWDGRVQMIVNAFLHVTMALLLLGLAWRATGPPGAFLFAALTALLFSTGISWENTVAGFQSQFYFALLFLALHVGGTLLAPARSWRWWLAPLAGAAGLFALASGSLSAMAVIAAVALRAVRDRRVTRDDLWVFAVNAVLVVAGVLLKADVPGHAVLKAAGPGGWLLALLHQFAWPVGFAWAAPLGIVPPLLLLWAYFRRQIDGPLPLTLIGASAWAALQCAATAYARGGENFGYSSRYYDSLAIAVLINFLTLLFLLSRTESRILRRWWIAGITAFVASVAWGFSIQVVDARKLILNDLPRVNEARIANVKAYIARHDPEFFKKAPWDEIPYPDAHRLADLLDVPALRASLPASVQPPIALVADPARTEGFTAASGAGIPAGHRGDGAPPSEKPSANAASDRLLSPSEAAAPAAPPPDSLVAWYTRRSSARFESEPFVAKHTRLTLFVTGENLRQDRIVLVDAAGREHAALGSLGHGGGWKRVNFAVPHGTYRLVAIHSGAGWLGFTQPTVNTLLSVAAVRVVHAGDCLLGAGFAVGLVAFLLLRPLPARIVVPPVRDWRSAVAALALALPIAAVLAVRVGVVHRPTGAHPSNDLLVRAFALAPAATPDRPTRDFVGGAFVLSGNAEDWFGTYVEGDAFTGRVVSTPFKLERRTLHVPITGYPTLAGNALELEILDDTGRPLRTVRYEGPNPGEHPGSWDVPIGADAGREARLVLTDGMTSPRGWLAVGTPVLRDEGGARWLLGVPRDYGWFTLCAAALAAMLFLPGLALRTGLPDAFPAGAAFVALPGLIVLAVGGLMAWLGGAQSVVLLAPWWLAGYVVAAIWLARRWWCNGGPLSRPEVGHLAAYAAVATAALAFGVLPLSVAQEYSPQTTEQSRMIASPPDHAIPYRTAVYFWFGKTGTQDRALYFGQDWSAASRGPIAPFVVTAAFALFDVQPHDPPAFGIEAWPAAEDGYHLARIIGILTNALVILAGAMLAARLESRAVSVALCWLAVAPVVAINTDYLWPKLLATSFLLLAVESVFGKRSRGWTGVCIALAYLSHPVGGLFAVPVLTLIAHAAWTETPGSTGRRAFVTLRAISAVAVVVAICLAPWLAYKAWLGFGDPFWRYPLGDGHGFAAARSFATWIKCRTDNIWLTLVPTTFYFSGFMRIWTEGPLSEPVRWALGYAKSLPGELGFAAFCVLAVAFARRPRSPALGLIRLHLLVGGFVFMVLFWGFSRDGLGRNCLEPLALFAIVYTAATWPGWRGWPWVVATAALESLSVRVIGVVGAKEFHADAINPDVLILSGIVVLATLAPAVWFLATRSSRQSS